MSKHKLIELAQQALLEGKHEIDDYYIYTAKIDLDVKLDKTDKSLWESTRKAILENFNDIVIDINTTETERGLHTTINYLCAYKLLEGTQNFMQLLLGDDIFRYKINKGRIEKGISMEEGNILFSKILERCATKEKSGVQIALERIVGEIK